MHDDNYIMYYQHVFIQHDCYMMHYGISIVVCNIILCCMIHGQHCCFIIRIALCILIDAWLFVMVVLFWVMIHFMHYISVIMRHLYCIMKWCMLCTKQQLSWNVAIPCIITVKCGNDGTVIWKKFIFFCHRNLVTVYPELDVIAYGLVSSATRCHQLCHTYWWTSGLTALDDINVSVGCHET